MSWELLIWVLGALLALTAAAAFDLLCRCRPASMHSWRATKRTRRRRSGILQRKERCTVTRCWASRWIDV